MIYLFVIILLLDCLLLVGAILIQNSKGGGLASNMAGAQIATQLMGARGASSTISKATWYMMGLLVALTFVLNVLMTPTGAPGRDERENTQAAPSPAPKTGAPAPGAPQPAQK